MLYTTLYLVIVFEATLVNVQSVNGAFDDLSEVMDEDDSILMARSSQPSVSRRSVSRFRDQMAQLQPTDTSKTSRAPLFLSGTGMFGSSQPARTILVAPAATSGALTGAACCPCTAATSGALIAGRLTAATGGFGWPSGFANSAAFTQIPAVQVGSTYPGLSGQLIAPLYLSSSQNQWQQQMLPASSNIQQQQMAFSNNHHPQQQQSPQQQQQQSHPMSYNQGQGRLPFASEEGQMESLADGKRKTRRLSTRG